MGCISTAERCSGSLGGNSAADGADAAGATDGATGGDADGDGAADRATDGDELLAGGGGVGGGNASPVPSADCA
jgi:hypothetical protein